jgi:hypothetical protein
MAGTAQGADPGLVPLATILCVCTIAITAGYILVAAGHRRVGLVGHQCR